MKLLSQAALFVPGDSERKLAKAATTAAGMLILDLEDSLLPRQKETARETLAHYLEQKRSDDAVPRQKVAIRCNAVGTTEFRDDVKLLKRVQYDAVMLPKCEAPSQILEAAEALPGARFIALIETALGVHQFAAVATAHPSVVQAAFGAVDFALDLGVEWSARGEERLYAMSRVAVESRALRLAPPIDAVFPAIDDEAAFARDARLGVQLGYALKMVIHPRQIEWLERLTRLSPEEEARYRRIVRLYEENARSGGGGAVSAEGMMVDLPVYELARRRLGLG